MALQKEPLVRGISLFVGRMLHPPAHHASEHVSVERLTCAYGRCVCVISQAISDQISDANDEALQRELEREEDEYYAAMESQAKKK